MSRSAVAQVLQPRSLAVVGASNDPAKRGHQTIRRLLADGYPHPIYPVNPREERILGLPVYPSVSAIDAPVDLALVVTPATVAAEVVTECAQAGIPAAIVIAVGFGETGEDGQQREAELVEAAAAGGIALLGPNTNGVFNTQERLNLLGTSDVPVGRLSLLCQSGNVGLALVTQIRHKTDLGLCCYVGIGNEAGLRFDAFLGHLAEDEHTDVILVYAEGFRDGQRFLTTARTVGAEVPIVLYKAGRSEVGRQAARSHTGVVAGEYPVARAVLRQAGVEVVDRSDELVPVASALADQPALAGSGIAVLADGGGHATIAADALHHHGLHPVDLAPEAQRRLAALLPPAACTRNPVDVAGATDGDPSIFADCLELLLDDPQVHGVLCVGLLGGYGIRFSQDLAAAEERTVVRMAALARDRGKALVVQSAYAYERPRAHDLLRAARVPVLSSVELAARCISALHERGRDLRWRAERSGFDGVLERSVGEARRVLTEPEGRRRLEQAGIALRAWDLVQDADAAAIAAARIGSPVALKVVSPDIAHKSDVGGVVLGVDGPDAARAAYRELRERIARSCPDARVDGVLVSAMAPHGVEVMIGATIDATFGPVLAVAAGGTLVEIHRDVAFRALAVTPREASEMLDELHIAPLFAGFRGGAAVDRGALEKLIVAVSALVAADPDIVELDLNPVVTHTGGAEPVDVRVVVISDPPAHR